MAKTVAMFIITFRPAGNIKFCLILLLSCGHIWQRIWNCYFYLRRSRHDTAQS